MLKRLFTYTLLFASLLLCTSCFEILEEISFNKDGSGRITVTANLSKSKSKLASVMLLDSVNGHKVPSRDDIDLAIKNAVDHLKKTEGISNIEKSVDYDNYIFSIACDFKSVANVNSIFKEMINNQNRREKTSFSTTNFSYNDMNHQFKRHFKYDDSIKRKFNSLKSEDKKVFNDASYTTIYRFNSSVKSVSNSGAKIAPNKKAVFMRVPALSLITGQQTLENTIQLINN